MRIHDIIKLAEDMAEGYGYNLKYDYPVFEVLVPKEIFIKVSTGFNILLLKNPAMTLLTHISKTNEDFTFKTDRITVLVRKSPDLSILIRPMKPLAKVVEMRTEARGWGSTNRYLRGEVNIG